MLYIYIYIYIYFSSYEKLLIIKTFRENENQKNKSHVHKWTGWKNLFGSLKHFCPIKLSLQPDTWKGAVNLPVRTWGRGFAKNRKFMSPRHQEVKFPESWTQILKIILWILFLIACRLADSWGSDWARELWQPYLKWRNLPSLRRMDSC